MFKKNDPISSQEIKPGKVKAEESSVEKKKQEGCCSGNSCSAPTVQPISKTSESLKNPKTRIIIKYNVGFSNGVYLRGTGANLSWDKGILLKNVKADEWTWETDQHFSLCEFKVLINDKQYETGENHRVISGSTIQYTPRF